MQRRSPGLESLNESRLIRKRQLVTGRVPVGGGIPPKVFLWGLAVLIVGGFIYFWHAQGQLEEQRRGILTKQRATAKLLGPKLIPMRDQIEKGVAQLVKGGKDTVDPQLEWDKLFRTPGLYLRARLEDGRDPEKLRRAATISLRDGFSACLIQDPSAKAATSGKACRESKECASGEYCNEYQFCQRPSSPFNMRMLYRALTVLSEKWVDEVRDAGTEIKLVAYDRALDSVTEVDLPLAIDIYQRAKYVVIVLDEDPKDGVPEALPGAEETLAERVQRVAHPARIGVFELPSGQLLARVTEMAEGELRDVGTRKPPGGPDSVAARARQANSCGLALGFRQTVLSAEAKLPSDAPEADAPESNAPESNAPESNTQGSTDPSPPATP